MHTNRQLTPTDPRLCWFALGVILWLAPLESQARPPRARERQCVIQTIERDSRTMTLQCGKDAKALELVWTKQTKFLQNGTFADVAPLKTNQAVVVYYRSPFFGKKFATKVVWENGSDDKLNKNKPTQ
ncbi:MAG: hypothetical protein AAB370_05110 [Verrucomicrobiota bacterium]